MEDTTDNNVRTNPDMSPEQVEAFSAGRISVAQAATLFIQAGVPRNQRSIRRYCERGDLDCIKTENDQHQPVYRIDPRSVQLYIEQQRALSHESEPDTSGPVRVGPDESGLYRPEAQDPSRHRTVEDTYAQVRTGPDESSESLFAFLMNQIGEKDKQINALLERDRETNFLIRGLQ